MTTMVARERLLAGFHLGECYIEPLSGRITRSDGREHLPPKAVQTLLQLAEEPGALVAREALLRDVWGEEKTSSYEKLSHTVSAIRHALSDDPHDPRFIQTVPKRGYRLLVEPTVDSPASAAAVDTTESKAERSIPLLGELKRRGVIETVVAYLVLGWLLIQVADITFEQLSLPAWAAAFVTYLVIVGFPIAIALAWFIEFTSKGAILDLDAASRPVRRHFSKPYVAILGALALASVGILVYDRTVGLPRTDLQPVDLEELPQVAVDPNSIAVLPFLNISGSEDGEIFATGLTEDLIDRLTKIPGLRVASRGDSFSLPPSSRSQVVRRRLRVAYYLEGSVRAVDDTLRVVVQLIDSSNGFHVVSRSFDRAREDFFAIQDEITSLAVANLRVALPAATRGIIDAGRDGTNLDAYRLYRRGMDALHKPMTRATIDEALDAFRRALSIDEDYAAAHAGICMTYASGYRVTDDPAYIDEAEVSCSDALALNANLDVVHHALGQLYSSTGRYEAAEVAYENALTTNANAVDSLLGLAAVYHTQKKLPEAETTFRQAIGLQPGNWSAYNALGGFLFTNGRYEEAAQQYREIVSLDGRNMTGWTNLGASLLLSGKFADAALAFERANEIQPTLVAYSNLGMLHYYLGDIDQALASLEIAVEMAPNDYGTWLNLGDVLSFSTTPERADQAFVRAEELAENRLQVNSRDAVTIRDLAWIKAMLGKFEQAAQLTARARDVAPGNPQVHYVDALILARRGESMAAIDQLEAAIDRGYPVAFIAAEPHLKMLRDEDRFQALIGRDVQ